MTATFADDPINNAINNGIKRGIDLTIEHNCLSSAVVLILSGIDTMAYLDMPKDQDDVNKKDFVAWAEKYIRFPGPEQLTGLDLYGARCAVLHTFGAKSKLSKNGKCRVILWTSHAVPPIMSVSNVPEFVIVAADALRDAVFAGIGRFLVDIFKQPQSARAQLVNKRLDTLIQQMKTQDVLNGASPSP